MIPDPQFVESDIDDKRSKIEALSRTVNNQNQDYFERILRRVFLSGTVDITDWTLEAIVVLVKVCSDEKMTITLKQGRRYFMPVHYPHKSLIECLVKAIKTGQF